MIFHIWSAYQLVVLGLLSLYVAAVLVFSVWAFRRIKPFVQPSSLDCVLVFNLLTAIGPVMYFLHVFDPAWESEKLFGVLLTIAGVGGNLMYNLPQLIRADNRRRYAALTRS